MKIISQVQAGTEVVTLFQEGEKYGVLSRNFILNKRVVHETFVNFTDAGLRYADVAADAVTFAEAA